MGTQISKTEKINSKFVDSIFEENGHFSRLMHERSLISYISDYFGVNLNSSNIMMPDDKLKTNLLGLLILTDPEIVCPELYACYWTLIQEFIH